MTTLLVRLFVFVSSERPLLCTGLLLGLATGCQPTPDGYDPAERFTPRHDPVVVSVPTTEPTGPHRPGELEPYLRDLAGLGGVVHDPASLPANDQAQLTEVLESLFGTPAQPRVAVEGDVRSLASQLGLEPDTLTRGASLYKDKCTQCHGMQGDGRGPTGPWVYPPPRDFRLGVSKFVSTASGKPTRADLRRILKLGVSGNAMPGFALLADEQLDALAPYTIYLSLRGKVEYDLLVALLGDGLEDEIPLVARDRLRLELQQWVKAEADAIQPGTPPVLEDADRIRQGFALFNGSAGCITCHADYGRKETYRYDMWGVAVRPANLTVGNYHGGSHPGDLFRRIRGGIRAVGMPAAPETLGDQDIWALVAFVKALPVPRNLPPDVRQAIYPGVE